MIRPYLLAGVLLLGACNPEKPADLRINDIDPAKAAEMAKQIEKSVTPTLADGLTLKIWGVDSLIADPVSIDIDDSGNLYFTRTNRQKNSEFDIRGHQDWEIESIGLSTIEDKRNFLRKVLSPENSSKNTWLADLNKDGSHDWKDMTVQKEHIYRVEDRSGDGIADRSQLVLEDFNDEVTDAAGGIMKHDDNLFVGIGPDLWQLKDKNKDGLIDEKKSLMHGYGIHVGFSGHGMSGIEVGPEGKIYWQIGDIGFNGVDATGKQWNHSNSGVICRANPDGSDFEVFAYGNRNTHEFVFDEYGNLISEDNDGDHTGEMERIVYIPNGADLGWRINWQFGKYRDPNNNQYKVWMEEKMHVPSFKGQPAYITPPIANFINGPTGMLYNPGGALGQEWRNTYFVVEFVGSPAQSGIHAFKLVPEGAFFKLGENKKIVGGILPTGIDFGPDGSMYVADWIDGWGTKDYGRVWKLDVANPDVQFRAEIERILKSQASKAGIAELESWLAFNDYRVRQKAQFELANNRKEALNVFTKTLANSKSQLARIHSIWGIRQLGIKDNTVGKHLLKYLSDADPEIRAQAAKWLGDMKFSDAGTDLIPLFTDKSPRVQFFAAEASGRIGYKPAIPAIIKLLETNDNKDVMIRHAGSLALARIGDVPAIIALKNHPSPAVRLAAVVALRRVSDPGIAGFLTDTDEDIATEAARAINDDLSITEALPALGDILLTTTFRNEALLRRAINANLRVGTDHSMEVLLQFIKMDNAPDEMRAEAMAALSTWAKPSVLDRVDGRFRGVVNRASTLLESKAGPELIILSSDKKEVIRFAAIKAMGKIKAIGSEPALEARLNSDPSASNRAEALQSLFQQGNVGMESAISKALLDKDKQVRVKALDLLPASGLNPVVASKLLLEVIKTKTVEEKQTAIEALGNLPVEHTKEGLELLVAMLEAKKLPTEIQLELADAVEKSNLPLLEGKLTNMLSKNSGDTLLAAFSGTLQGGNADKGAGIFYGHPVAQCIRCHALGDYGGNAGPALNSIGKTLTREKILESLLKPSARLAPGYGTISLKLDNNKTLNGLVMATSNSSITLRIANKGDTTIAKSSILSQTEMISSMPPMGTLLTKKEIRDVISFLATKKD